jgi:hypothetical protein
MLIKFGKEKKLNNNSKLNKKKTILQLAFEFNGQAWK